MISALRLKMDIPICHFFQQGRCAYGPACKFLHTTTSSSGAIINTGYAHHGMQHHQVLTVSQHGSASRGSRGRRHSLSSSHKDSRQGPVEPAFYERSWQELPQAALQQGDQEASIVGAVTFRLMSYNLLADHLSQQHANYLYPDRTHDEHLDWFRHRQPLALQEMQHWDPDVICAQEVDHYPELARELAKLGYAGAFMQRTGGHRDGCATFWRTSRFVAVRMEHVAYNRYDLKDNVALLVHLTPRVHHTNVAAAAAGGGSGNPPAPAHSLSHLNPSGSAVAAAAAAGAEVAGATASTVAAIEASGGVIVANTHILFNTRRGDVKLGQLRTVLGRLRDMAHTASCRGAHVGCMLAGDYNTTPGSPVYQFMQNGELHLNQHDKQLLSGQVEGMGHAQYQHSLRRGSPVKQGFRPVFPPTHHLARLQQAAQQQAPAQAQWQSPLQPDGYQPWAQGSQRQGATHPGELQQQQRQQVVQQQLGQEAQPLLRDERMRYVHWDDEGLRLALGVCPTTLPHGGLDEPAGSGRPQRADGHSKREAVRRQQARQGLLTVRSPLYPLQSAYATVAGHEPSFSTCHSRCIDTVDYIWYTPNAVSCPSQQHQAGPSSAFSPPLVRGISGSDNEAVADPAECDMDCGSGDDKGSGQGRGALQVSAELSGAGSSGSGRLRAGAVPAGAQVLPAGAVPGPAHQCQGHAPSILQPVRVLLPPDSTRFPCGMPNGRWASDHVSLVADFQLFLRQPSEKAQAAS